MYTILICDDEQDIVNSLKIFLENSGLQVVCAYNGAEAISAVESQRIDLILLDVMMPRLDGIKAMSLIRQASNVPVIILSAKGEEEDKISGLDLGADDYITKPYNPAELLARIRSQLRRYTTLGGCTSIEDVIKIGAICLDDREKKVSVDGEPISLTPTEYDILHLLMSNPGRVFSPREIYRSVWNAQPYCSEGTIAVHIRHLREKIEINPSDPRYLKVVWGQGYKILQ